MFLRSNEINELKEGTFELYCSYMELKSESKTLKGKGKITQTINKSLKFEFFPEKNYSSSFYIRDTLLKCAGGKSDKYVFVARDANKRIWTSPQAIDLHHSESVSIGYLSYLESKSEDFDRYKDEIDNIKYYFFEDFTYPVTDVKKQKAEFQSCGYKFSFQEDNNIKVLLSRNVRGVKRYYNDFESKILEAMSFVFSMPINYNIRVLKNNKGNKCTLFPQVVTNKKNSYPPYNFRYYKTSRNEINIYKKYLEYICKNQSDFSHDISDILRCYYEMKSNAIRFETFNLPSAICIEHVLQNLYSQDFQKKRFDEDKKKMNYFLKKYKNNIQLSENCISVIKNAIGNANNVGTNDILKQLIEYEVITGQQKKVWNDIRHHLVHRGKTNSSNMPQDSGILIDLLHLLILYEIGYTGKYITYANSNDGRVGDKVSELNPIMCREKLRINKVMLGAIP